MTASVGRPRNPAKDVAVLQATRELLVEAGYQGTSVMAIARRAGVGAPTIYRRWPTKESLVEDAAFGHPQPAPLPRPTGELLADLRSWVAVFLDWLADPAIRAALPGLLTAYHRDEQIYERLVLRAEADVRSLMGELLGSALPDLPRTEIAARTDVVFDFLVAATVVRAMTRGLLDRDGFCERTARALRALALATE
ncbi:transcriptional regulator [Mycolicibacterium chubuense NBB4]|uniref:Transcriptional regulator n=1 Tax=Mycolicibacterium chubuense (strain NBB4) TaxID=710421 RepID=I4BMN8_MYCCN|nr:TetR/AcrR family transcriptional regulator [Mycolicibacterium chubuense]AFM18545.1 transcriptional regulator [Mycolicibacterium chubuense NBB4]